MSDVHVLRVNLKTIKLFKFSSPSLDLPLIYDKGDGYLVLRDQTGKSSKAGEIGPSDNNNLLLITKLTIKPIYN